MELVGDILLGIMAVIGCIILLGALFILFLLSDASDWLTRDVEYENSYSKGKAECGDCGEVDYPINWDTCVHCGKTNLYHVIS